MLLGGFHLAYSEFRPRRADLQQVAEMRRLRFDYLRSKGGEWREGERGALLCRSDHGLQCAHRCGCQECDSASSALRKRTNP